MIFLLFSIRYIYDYAWIIFSDLTIIVVEFPSLIVRVVVVAEGSYEHDPRDEAHEAHERRHREGYDELHLAADAAHKLCDDAQVLGALLVVLRVDEGEGELHGAHEDDEDAGGDVGDRDGLALAHGGDEADDPDQDQDADHNGARRDPVGAVLLRGVDQLVDVVQGEQHHYGRYDDDEHTGYFVSVSHYYYFIFLYFCVRLVGIRLVMFYVRVYV